MFGTENNKEIAIKRPPIPVERKGNLNPPKLYNAEPTAGPTHVKCENALNSLFLYSKNALS